jgi:hypothetical protein
MSFYPLPNELEWSDYTGPLVEVDLSRWKFRCIRQMSTCLHNEMNAREGHAHYRRDICNEICHNRKTCPNWQVCMTI